MVREYYPGRNNYLIYAEETSYGSGGTPGVSNNFGRVQNVSLEMSNNFVVSQGIGEGANATSVVLGRFSVSGSLTTEPVDFTFLQYGIGQRSGAGTSGDPYLLEELDVHGYSSNQLPSLNMELGSKALSNHQVKQVTGTVFNSWSLEGEQGSSLSCNMAFKGRTVNRSTSIETFTALSGLPVVFNSGSCSWNSETLSVRRFSVSCDYPSSNPQEVFDRFDKQPIKGQRRYRFTLTMDMHFDNGASIVSSNELLDEFFYASDAPDDTGAPTGRDLVINITEGGASGDRDITIQLENAFIESWSETPAQGDDFVPITVTGIALAGKDETGTKVPVKWFTN